jgi:hypothetical protein
MSWSYICVTLPKPQNIASWVKLEIKTLEVLTRIEGAEASRKIVERDQGGKMVHSLLPPQHKMPSCSFSPI